MDWVLLLLSWGLLLVVIMVFGTRAQRLADAAYAQGLREGIDTAIDVARDRSSLARELAPAGELGYGMVRAQMADQIEFDLQQVRLSIGSDS